MKNRTHPGAVPLCGRFSVQICPGCHTCVPDEVAVEAADGGETGVVSHIGHAAARDQQGTGMLRPQGIDKIGEAETDPFLEGLAYNG